MWYHLTSYDIIWQDSSPTWTPMLTRLSLGCSLSTPTGTWCCELRRTTIPHSNDWTKLARLCCWVWRSSQMSLARSQRYHSYVIWYHVMSCYVIWCCFAVHQSEVPHDSALPCQHSLVWRCPELCCWVLWNGAQTVEGCRQKDKLAGQSYITLYHMTSHDIIWHHIIYQGDINRQLLANLERRQAMSELALLSEGRFQRKPVEVNTLSAHHCKLVGACSAIVHSRLSCYHNLCRSLLQMRPSGPTWGCCPSVSRISFSALHRMAGNGLLLRQWLPHRIRYDIILYHLI